MKKPELLLPLLVALLTGCQEEPAVSMAEIPAEPIEIPVFGKGPHAVGSTNIAIAAEYDNIGDDAMHGYLLGQMGEEGESRYLLDILAHPESAWVTDAVVPGDPEVYGTASGLTLPVVSYVMYPSSSEHPGSTYTFPYHNGNYGSFDSMLEPDATPAIAEEGTRFPLVVLAHGANAHGLFDVAHAQDIASHGYIVAVLTFGDSRTMKSEDFAPQVGFLRPLLTSAVISDLLSSTEFGPRIDADNIAVSGHSFGGFTALAAAGGEYFGNPGTAYDSRVTAAAIAAPWVGGDYGGGAMYAFGEDNATLEKVTIPVISFFGTLDDVTLASYILPAMQRLSGPTYVVELVDQPHVFDGGSWEDRNIWELLFLNAYLKQDASALELLKKANSAAGGNEDWQQFDYQKLPVTN